MTGWAAGKSGFFLTKTTRPTESTLEIRRTLILVTGRPLLGSLWNLNRLCSQTEHTSYVYHSPDSPVLSGTGELSQPWLIWL